MVPAIQHFTHPGHHLTPRDGGQAEFLCDGCKTLGTGKRYRCTTNGCDFDLHDYCATCPRSLTSFMHPNHALTLVMRKQQGARQVNRICNVCGDSVEGLFYRCKECEFDVHPLCTQLPEKLHHALDKIHPLILQSEKNQGLCDVCRGGCAGWRYRCGVCDLDVHLECVLVPFVSVSGPGSGSGQGNNGQTSQRGIPFQPPPQYAGYYHYGVPYSPGYYNHFGAGCYHNNFGQGVGMQQGQYMYPNNLMGQNQVGGGGGNNNGGRRRRPMFALVGQLAFGVISDMIFGVDITSLFLG